MLDSRCGRMLDDTRSMLSEEEFDWVESMVDGDYDHLLIGTSVPWLLAPALHAVEAWNERMCERPGRTGQAAEQLRQLVDLEHWAAFGHSFDRLARLIADVAAGRRGPSSGPPATVCVLSGDVHHSYVARADYDRWRGVGPVTSRVYQLTCSPVHNRAPGPLRLFFRVSWNSGVDRVIRGVLARSAEVRRRPLRWRLLDRIVQGNAISTLLLEGRAARVVVESGTGERDSGSLRTALAADLASARD